MGRVRIEKAFQEEIQHLRLILERNERVKTQSKCLTSNRFHLQFRRDLVQRPVQYGRHQIRGLVAIDVDQPLDIPRHSLNEQLLLTVVHGLVVQSVADVAESATLQFRGET